jgi:hypothetical protein
MQQTVPGIQVENVIGQSIVIYTQQVPTANRSATTPGANVNQLPSTTNRIGQRQQSGIGQSGAGARGLQATGQVADRTGTQQTTGLNQPNGSPTPIAAGVIRLSTDQSSTTTPATPAQPSASLPATQEELR